jgi:hypothetical protein
MLGLEMGILEEKQQDLEEADQLPDRREILRPLSEICMGSENRLFLKVQTRHLMK